MGIPLVHRDDPGDSSYSYWLPDSGTTTHMTPFLSDLLPESIQEHKSYVTVANNRRSIVTHRGTVRLRVHCCLSKDEKERTWDLFNVLVVPNLAKRLISMDELNSFGHEVTFSESTFNSV